MIIKTPKKGFGMGWKPQMPDHRDYLFEEHTAFVPTLKDVPPTGDVTHLIPWVKNQLTLGCCTGEGSSDVFEAYQVKSGITPVLSNIIQIYQDARKINGDYPGDNGANVRDAIQATVKNGVAPDALYPFIKNISKFDDPLPADVVAAALKDETTKYYLLDSPDGVDQTVINMMYCIGVLGLPWTFGTPVYSQFEDVGPDGLVAPPKGNEIGGHCMACYKYDAKYFYVLNSWGDGTDGTPPWGMPFVGAGGKQFPAGMCAFPIASYKKLFTDCWAVTDESGLTPSPTPTPTPTPTPAPSSVTKVIAHEKKLNASTLQVQLKTEGVKNAIMPGITLNVEDDINKVSVGTVVTGSDGIARLVIAPQ